MNNSSCRHGKCDRLLFRYRASKVPEQPLVMWGYELSPFVKIVKETLAELELPYMQKTCSRCGTAAGNVLSIIYCLTLK